MRASNSDLKTWRDRDQYLDGLTEISEETTTSLRPEIEASWRRCHIIGVSVGSHDIPYSPDVERDSRLRRAAGAVIDRIAGQLADAPLTILLADSSAQIVDRRAGGDGAFRARLDRALIAPGFRYAEEYSGTNGIGTALEERRLFQVRGGEHFRESLQNMTCVGAPIVHPIGRTVEGILDITSNTSNTNYLMAPLVLSAVREIQSRLYDEASRNEQMLLSEFLRASRRGSSAVVSVNQDVIMTNPAAARIVDPSDQALLWDWATRMLAGREDYVGEVRLARGLTVVAKAQRISDGIKDAGILIEMKVQSRDTGSTHGHRPTPKRPLELERCPNHVPLVGRSLATELLQNELEQIKPSASPVLITGEPGVGKFFAARHLHQMREAKGRFTVFDGATAGADVKSWIAVINSWLNVSGTIVVKHIDAIPVEIIPSFARLIDDASEGKSRIIATALEEPDDPASARLRDHFMSRVSVVPLRYRTEEISDIAPLILRKHAPGMADVRLQPAALQILMARDWPGNVRELESVLASAIMHSMGSDIALQHLPHGYRDPAPTYRRNISNLERVERDAVIQALEETGGNKAAAADRLGIARSTLYRKIRALGIESDRLIVSLSGNCDAGILR